jgi:hypothetical protein
VSAGQTITYAIEVSDESFTLTTGAVSTSTHMRGVQFNGYIFNSATSQTAASTSTTLSSSSNAATTVVMEVKSGLSTGATVGIAVGAAMVSFALCCILGWFLLRRHRANGVAAAPYMDSAGLVNVEIRSEMDGKVYQELPGSHMPHELHDRQQN